MLSEVFNIATKASYNCLTVHSIFMATEFLTVTVTDKVGSIFEKDRTRKLVKICVSLNQVGKGNRRDLCKKNIQLNRICLDEFHLTYDVVFGGAAVIVIIITTTT